MLTQQGGIQGYHHSRHLEPYTGIQSLLSTVKVHYSLSTAYPTSVLRTDTTLCTNTHTCSTLSTALLHARPQGNRCFTATDRRPPFLPPTDRYSSGVYSGERPVSL